MENNYLITFKKRQARKEKAVEMPGLLKLLAWIAENAGKCDSVLIQRCELAMEERELNEELEGDDG